MLWGWFLIIWFVWGPPKRLVIIKFDSWQISPTWNLTLKSNFPFVVLVCDVIESVMSFRLLLISAVSLIINIEKIFALIFTFSSLIHNSSIDLTLFKKSKLLSFSHLNFSKRDNMVSAVVSCTTLKPESWTCFGDRKANRNNVPSNGLSF